MADQSLQAFQLGASLFDRAQTQQRMMEQLQVQTADQIMRQRQADLQNKVQTFALGRAMKDQEDDLADVDNMNYNVQAVDTFFINPNAPFPTFRPVKSAKNQGILNQYRQQLDDYSERSKLMKGLAASKSALTSQLTKAQNWAEENNQYDVIWDNNNGLDQYGNIDPQKIRQIYSILGPKIQASQNLGKASKLADYGSVAAINSSSETPEVKAQAISIFTAKQAEQFPKEVRALMALGTPEAILAAPAADQNAKDAAIKGLAAAQKAKLSQREPLKAAVEDWKNAPPEKKNEAFQLLQAQASKFRRDVSISPYGEIELKAEIPAKTRQDLIGGIRAANTAISEIDKITDDQIESAFGLGSGFQSATQSLGLSGIPYLGLNKDQIEIESSIELLKSLVSRSLLNEKGVQSDKDKAIAARVLNADFSKLNPEQFRGKLNNAKRLFEDSIKRMESPLGIVALEEVKSGGQQSEASAQSAEPVIQTFSSMEEAETYAPVGARVRVGNKVFIKE
jgi:hypothetical protein